MLNENISIVGTKPTKQKRHRYTWLTTSLTAEEGLAFWESQREPQLLAAVSLRLPSFSSTFPFSSSSTFFFPFSLFKGDSSNTISVHHSRSWGVFSHCHSPDCFGRRHSSCLDSRSVSFFLSFFFVNNTYTAIFKFTFFYWGRVHCQAEQGNTAQLWKYTAYFLNSVPTSVCLQSKQIAMELSITGFQTEKEK